MIEDIDRFYPDMTAVVKTGIFSEDTAGWSKISPLLKKNAGLRRTEKYTKSANLAGYRVTENCNLLDMLYGDCDPYAHVFVDRNPEWSIGVALRETDGYLSLIHEYAYRKEKERTLFADVRGITDNARRFFSDFTLSKKTLRICDRERPVVDTRFDENRNDKMTLYAYWTQDIDDAGYQNASMAYDMAVRNGFYRQ